MKKIIFPAILTVVSLFLFGCADEINYPSYENIESSMISVPKESRYVIETCVDIEKGRQNKEFSPRYTITSASQTGENNIIEIGMTEVRYVRGDRQEQNMFLYCSRFIQNGNDVMNSHRNYLDTMDKYLAEKGYTTIHVPL
ncbi:hypothetical protein [Pseudoalteromonas prydzensis]|uniref:hypothetical protein n=1 Tax=Pseudoalteromonas prydzensis TaxID=182141 RepID=UPI003703B15C